MSKIPNDLLAFKDKMSHDALKGALTSAEQLSQSMNNLQNINGTAVSGIDSYYSSSKKASLFSSIDKLNQFYIRLEQGASADITHLVNESDTLLTEVETLVTKEKTIEELKNAILYTTDSAKKLSAQENLNKLVEEFNQLLDSAISRYAGLKSYTGNMPDFAAESVAAATTAKPVGVKFSGYTNINVNGKKVRCYLYIPEFDDPNYRAPLIQSMYGLGVENKGEYLATERGLAAIAKQAAENPSSEQLPFAVCTPVVTNGRYYEYDSFIQDISDLPLEVCDEFNLDSDRISLVGTSYGAIAGYKMVKQNPGRFSAMLSSYGTGEIDSSLADLGIVINYTGQGGDTPRTNIKNIKAGNDAINSLGGNSIFKAYDETWNHTNVGDMAIRDTVVGTDGVERPVLEELIRHKRKGSTIA